MKLLLNQQNLSETGRLLYYYQSLNLYRINAIKKLQTNLEKIKFIRNICTLNINVAKIPTARTGEQNNLTAMKTNRSQLIMAINQKINDQKHQLEALSANKKHLEQTLIHLARLTQAKIETKPGISAISISRLNMADCPGQPEDRYCIISTPLSPTVN